jgi:hypothetical protein
VKKYLVSLLSIPSILLLLVITGEDHNSVYAYASGAQAGYSGSPGDNNNCTSCHSGTAVSLNGLITSDIPVSGYLPGNTYTITATITTTGVVKFGFEISAQNTAGSKRGTLVITNSTQTQLVGSGKYITHKLAGTGGSSGSKTWTFNWTAPILGSGDVTFYGAFNSTNNDGTNNGDHITLSEMLVHENTLTTSFHEPLADAAIAVFPNPASSFINITPVSGSFINLVSIFDLTGKKVLDETITNNDVISLDIQSLKAGVYILMMNADGKVLTRKIVVS